MAKGSRSYRLFGGRIIDNRQIENLQIDNWQIDNPQIDNHNLQIDNRQIDNQQITFFAHFLRWTVQWRIYCTVQYNVLPGLLFWDLVLIWKEW